MVLLLSLLACVTDPWTPPEVRAVEAGAPVVGAAEGFLKLPVGTPLSGFSVRCSCLTGVGSPDARDSAYTHGFIESAGVHTHPQIKVIWIENGDDHLVITKTDSIYSNDALVKSIEARLTEATGLDLDGKVIHTANHSHNSYGDFSDAITFYLGSDKHNEEIFQRFSKQVADVALQAFEARQPAKIGLSITPDWDPDDRVFHDRRGVNNNLVVGEPPLLTGKDPDLRLMRFDDINDNPIAMLVNFGMHGIVLGEDNALVSTDSSGGVEAYVSETFDDEVVVMFTQGSGGDQSPGGEQDRFARIESIGDRAADLIHTAWESTPTSADPFTMQTASRAIQTHPRLMHVTRGGTVDYRYATPEESTAPDNEIWGPSGELLSPIDEFPTDYGAVFCGTGDIPLPGGSLPGVEIEPYANCVQVETMGVLIANAFDVDVSLYGLDPAEAELPLPLPDTLRANTTASVFSQLLVRDVDGSESQEEFLFGFFPGEATHMYNQMFQRRAQRELGFSHSMMISYAQDHEGYLLIPEDWVMGGYEPDIAVWGPLQGEHVMEQVLNYTDELLRDDVHQPADPLGQYQITNYPDRPLPTAAPDVTPLAGTQIFEVPDTFWLPDGFELDLTIPQQVPRVQGSVQVAWQGGDPGVDDPVVTLEKLVGTDWVQATTASGRPLNDSYHDFLKAHTPDPLAPADALQEHYWWITWQAVSHVKNRTGLPLGTYRLRIDGKSFAGSATTWPWDTTDYSFTSDSFEVVAGELSVQSSSSGLSVSFPAHGYRYIEAGGDSLGDNPVPGTLTVSWDTPNGPVVEELTGTQAGARTELAVTPPAGATAVTVTDMFGNHGQLAL